MKLLMSYSFRVRLQMIDDKRCVIVDKPGAGVVIRTNKKTFEFMKQAGFKEMRPLTRMGIFR